MAGASDDLRRLREALAGLVADDVPGLVAEARAEARARVRAVLTEVMADAMLEQARQTRGAAGPDRPDPAIASAPAEPAPRPPATAPPRTSRRPDPGARSAPARSPRPDGRDHSDDGELGYYVYGVTTADFGPLPDVAGVDPAHAVMTLPAGDLAALVSQVPLAEFNEERLREHLGDIAWVETVARRHEEVLEAAAGRGTVIPMRLCSLYRDAEGVGTMLEREAGPMHDALRLLDGRAEWGVKVFAVSRAAPPAAEAEPPQPESGAAYLEQQRQVQRRREAIDERIAEACESMHGRLNGVAARAAVIAPQRPEVSGHEGEMVLNGVYLVDDSVVAAFHETVAALERDFGPMGIELVATGPWPAYNFVPDAIGVPT